MNIVTPDISENERLRSVGYDLVPSGFFESIWSSAKEALIRSPSLSLARMGEIVQHEGNVSPIIDPMGMTPPRLQGLSKLPSKKLTEQEFQKSEYFREGLSFPDGVREDVAAIIADRKDEEVKRQDIFERSQGKFNKGSQLAAALVASVLDPINVASAFVPIVGEARYASILARTGKLGARAITGAVEGTAGAAMMEPLVLAASKQEQADYGMVDSLINVAFGGVFGGGLHVGAGAIGDLLKTARPHTRETALKVAIGQAADGRPVEVEPILALDDTIGDEVPAGAFEKLQAEMREPTPEPATDLNKLKDLQENLTVDHAQGELNEILSEVQGQLEAGSIGRENFSRATEAGDQGLLLADDYENAVNAAIACLRRVL